MKGIIVVCSLGVLAGVFVFSKRRGSFAILPGKGGLAIGDVVEEFNGVKIYYNGAVGNSIGRRRAADGYNFGQGFQCVEFVKRYYYEKLDHRMPNTWGHAKDFFDTRIADGEVNPARALLQFRNGAGAKPKVDDLIIFGPGLFNSFGHVAIVSEVGDDQIEIAQQNPGPRGASRVNLDLRNEGGGWRVANDRVLGWLRMP
ncbi:CHAP domain-containing protein [Verrucomicrobiaceae bacterium 227]